MHLGMTIGPASLGVSFLEMATPLESGLFYDQ